MNKPIKDPQIFVSKTARDIYDNMRKLDEFKNLDNKDLLFLAIIFGYIHNRRKKLDARETHSSGFTRERYLSDSENGILKAIAVTQEEKIDVINDIQLVYSIAEEYANGGVELLKEFVFDNPASFIKKYSSEIKKHFNNL